MAERHAGKRPLDRAALAEHPLPEIDPDTDKNARGRVLAIGGCTTVPGGIALTAEAAFRAGAGKVQIATVEPAAIALGVRVPEAAVLPLPVNAEGEIASTGAELGENVARCDAVVVGPAMSCEQSAAGLLGGILDRDLAHCGLIVDAAALMSLTVHEARLGAGPFPAILTPHPGELAALLGCEAADIARDRVAAVRDAARRYASVVVAKDSTTLIATPGGALFAYEGGGPGLATGGSGDVLAGIAAGLLARGCPALTAALWAVWLHGEAGRLCAREIGPIGFLSRELPRYVPGLLASAIAT